MGSEWREVRLSDAVELIGGGTPKRSVPEYWGGTIPWLSVKDFNDDLRHVDSAEETITELGLAKSSTKMLEEGQLIISARGTVGALAQLSKPMAFNQSCYGINAKPEHATNDFLYHLIKYSLANLRQITHGAVFDTITRETFNHILVNLPPLPEQRAIAHILGSLDDKIELNRRMNETLEAMAQALFKSWFNDFDPVIDNALIAGNPIPGEFAKRAEQRRAILDQNQPSPPAPLPEVEGGDYRGGYDFSGLKKTVREQLPNSIRQLFPSEFECPSPSGRGGGEGAAGLGWIPKGWGISKIGDLLELAYGKALAAKVREPGPFAVYGSGGITGYHKEAIVEGPGIIVGRKGTVGSVYWESDDFFPIDTVFFVKMKTDAPLYWIYQNLLQMDIASLGADSAVPGVNRNAILAKEWVTPKETIFNGYWKFLSPYIQKKQELTKQNKSLVAVRDTLLPKLLSGELRIPDAEKLVEASV